jgi:hypothetical protein
MKKMKVTILLLGYKYALKHTCVETELCLGRFIYIYCSCEMKSSLKQTKHLGTRVLDTTHHLDVVDIYAKLFKNPLMHDNVTVWKLMCTFKLFLWA